MIMAHVRALITEKWDYTPKCQIYEKREIIAIWGRDHSLPQILATNGKFYSGSL
jgi:hypothetical protein